MEKANKVRIKRGDTVVVISGKDKGKKGKILAVDVDNGTVVVDGVNMVTKHKKARSAQQKSAREKRPGNIHISNVQILCKCGKATRVGYKFVGDKKVRVCAKCEEVLDKKFVKVKEKAKEEVVEEKKEEKTDKKPLQRREVKATADTKIKKPESVSKTMNLPRKTGGS